MPKIINIEGSAVKIGNEDGKVTKVPIASLTYSGAKIGDEVEVFKDGGDYIVNKAGKKSKSGGSEKTLPKLKKKTVIICASVVGGIALVVCAIIFLPKIFDKDASSPSSYPNYYNSLKEEKAAATKALEVCNKAAKAKDGSTDYKWDDVEAVQKTVYDYSSKTALKLESVPASSDNMDKRYDCYATVQGDSVQEIYIRK